MPINSDLSGNDPIEQAIADHIRRIWNSPEYSGRIQDLNNLQSRQSQTRPPFANTAASNLSEAARRDEFMRQRQPAAWSATNAASAQRDPLRGLHQWIPEQVKEVLPKPQFTSKDIAFLIYLVDSDPKQTEDHSRVLLALNDLFAQVEDRKSPITFHTSGGKSRVESDFSQYQGISDSDE